MTDAKTAGGEPAVEELLADPIVRLLLASDGLTVDDVRRTVAAARRALNSRREGACAPAEPADPPDPTPCSAGAIG